MTDLRKTSLGRHLIRTARESLGAEGITFSDKQWERIVSAACNTNNALPKTSSEMADSRKISQSLTQIYKRIYQ